MTTTPFFTDPPYFNLPALAKRWKQTEAALEPFIISGELPSVPELAVIHKCRAMEIFVSDAALEGRTPNPEEPKEVNEFTAVDGILYVQADDWFDAWGDPGERAKAEQKAIDQKQEVLWHSYKMDPVVLLADVLAFEQKHGIKTKTPPVRGVETLNTPDHPAFAPELAAAVHVWLSVYANMQSVEEVKALQGVKRFRAYKKALKAGGYGSYVSESHESKIGTDAGDRLSSVVNPQATKR